MQINEGRGRVSRCKAIRTSPLIVSKVKATPDSKCVCNFVQPVDGCPKLHRHLLSGVAPVLDAVRAKIQWTEDQIKVIVCPLVKFSLCSNKNIT